uniref:FHA domain-containing protein n=1 Tax=Phytophthora ramorum TaxID=164328 RepID=H3GCI9_PHYRM
MDTPGRAAFLCTSTASFHAPDWACMPVETNSHARLDAFRDNRHCATYMVGTQRVNLFGRDQESCDHVLGNPSVSRKHAAVIHDGEGGIFMVDLMSRHGTYVGRKKIPPHDPYLLHEGDVIKFGQSVRVYILKGAGSDGKICYGTLRDEKVATFITGVLELGDEDKQNLCVGEFEKNLDVFTHISQQRNDNIYRADSRKLLQAIAAVRLDPDNPQFNDVDSTEEDVGSACPPTANNREGRERSMSDEGKKLFLAGHGMPYPGRTESVGTISDTGRTHRETIGDPRYQTSHYPSGSDYDDHDGGSDSRSMDNGYAPPVSLMIGNGTKPAVNSGNGSGFNFIGQQASEVTKPSGSAFGFIGSSDPVDDTSSRTSSTEVPSGQSAEFSPKPPSVAAEDFLLENLSVDNSEFGDMWESANDESEEWSVDLGSVDAHELDPRDLQVFLEAHRLMCVSSKKVAGQQQWLFVAEQKAEGTLFLVDISVMPGLTDMSVTLKWIVNSLLYRNGHVIFMKILKYALHQFAEQAQERVARTPQPPQPHLHDTTQNHVQRQPQNGRELEPTVKAHPAPYPVSRSVSRTASHATSLDDDEEDAEEVDSDEDTMSALDYLAENPAIDAGKFEQVWATASEIASLSYTLNEVPEVDEVIDLFRSNCLGCLASGSVDTQVKFFFFAEMHSDEEEEQIDSSFVSFIEDVLQEL